MAIPFPLYIRYWDPVVQRECRWKLIDYKPSYGMAEYESECSGRTVLLTAEEAWKHVE